MVAAASAPVLGSGSVETIFAELLAVFKEQSQYIYDQYKVLKHGSEPKLSQHLGPKFRDVAKAVFKTKNTSAMTGKEFSQQMSKLEATLPPLMETLSQLGHDAKYAAFGPKAEQISQVRSSVFAVMSQHLPLAEGNVLGARAIADVFTSLVNVIAETSTVCTDVL